MIDTAVRRDRRAERRHSPMAPGPVRRLHARWRRITTNGDAGGATVELVIAMPLLLLMVMFVIQAGVWMHATHIAQAAATRAASAASSYQGSAGAGRDSGSATLGALGTGVLLDPTVSVSRTATEVRVEITGTAETVVPGVHWKVRAVVVRPVERFVPDTGGAQ